MDGATKAVADRSRVKCDCGNDHRATDTRYCAIFSITNDLHQEITEFLDAQDVFEFGKEGPLAHSLRDMILRQYKQIIDKFNLRQTTSENHPEWNLSKEISRLRRYFDQVADGRVKDIPVPPPRFSCLSDIDHSEQMTLVNAQDATVSFHVQCYDIVCDWMLNGMPSLSFQNDDDGLLRRVDVAFNSAFEKIALLPMAESKLAKDLTESSYEARKETRRLLCDYRRRRRAYGC